MPPADWTAESVVPGVYTDGYHPIIVIYSGLVGSSRLIVWTWLPRKGISLGEWTIHRLPVHDDFLDRNWKRTITFRIPE